MIIYISRTGNVEYIVNKLNLPSVNMKDVSNVSNPYFIFTYTDGLGEVPLEVSRFLNSNHKYCKGVIASGNRNFGTNNFCGCADTISKKYSIPVIHKIDLRGFESDYEIVKDKYKEHLGGK